jgi:hypothetical protein
MVPGADPKLYEEVKDVTALVPTIEEYLSDYNAESKTPMKLVRYVVTNCCLWCTPPTSLSVFLSPLGCLLLRCMW